MERKLLSSLLCFLLCITVGRAQNLEVFEDEPLNQKFFTSNSQVFNITTQAGGTFQVYSVGPGFGWNGTVADDKYIDNFTTKQNNVPFTVTIATAGAVPFVLKSFYGYLANYQDLLNVSGSLTVVGKLGGVTQFTATASTGFNTTLASQNGFTFINMTTYGGSNNSNKAIDELVLSSTNNYHYIAIDAFKWAPAYTVASSSTGVSCNGGANGTATVTPSGGTPGYTYSWAPSGGTAATATGLTAGNYTCTITDAASVTYVKVVTVSQPTAITSSLTSQTNVACNGGSTGAATITASGGAGGYTYNWTPGNPTGDGTVSVSGLTAGTWTCTVTDANSCTQTQTATITQPTAITSSLTSQTNVACNGGTTGAATITASGGAGGYTYNWTPGNPTGDGTVSVSGLTAGTWTCTVTDANSCTKTQTVTITQPASTISGTTVVTNISCFGGSNGSIDLTPTGGTPGYTYNWGGGITTQDRTGLVAGTYTVTITDANACTGTVTATVTEPTALVATIASTNVSCNGGTNGTATVTATGGTGTKTYSWAPSGGTAATASGLAAGTYTVTVTDANMCMTTQTVSITEPAALVASIASKTNVACNGASNGAATATVTGGTPVYTYSWAPSGGTAATASGLAAGTYTVTVTDANMCMTTQTVSITEPAALVASIASKTNVACNGASNGAATATVTGGTPVYTYSWAPSGGTAATASGLAAGTYTVTITDANMCMTTQTVSITEPVALVASIASKTNVACNGASNGAATATVTGGTPVYTYSWAPSGGTAATASGLAAGTYTVTITDANMCMTTQTVSITQPAVIATTQTVSICAGASLVVGTSTYTISGTYTDKLQSKSGCDSTVTTVLTVNTPVNVTVSVAANVITANATGSTYQWIDCINGNSIVTGATSQSYTALITGSYAVIVTTNNCSDTSVCTPIIVTGIDVNSTATVLTVYPNPNNGTFTIHSTLAGTYMIINELGQAVHRFQLNGTTDQTANISELSNGTYYILGMSMGQLIKQKIVVIH